MEDRYKINVEECKFETTFTPRDAGCVIHYYDYPVPFGDIEFYHDDNYGRVVTMCLAVEQYDDGRIAAEISPTVYDSAEDAFVDVDWMPLVEGEN